MLPLVAALALAGSSADAAMAGWMQCLADKTEVYAPSPEPAETVADATMGGCAAEEGALREIERRGTYGEALRRLERADSDGRAVLRQRVIARVLEIRARR